MAILTTGTGVSIMIGSSEYADETTEYALEYEEPDTEAVPFLDGHSETPTAASRAWKIKLTGARDETAESLYDYLWTNDGSDAAFTIVDQAATYTFTAQAKPAPLSSKAGEANMFEVELPITGEPLRTGAPATP